MYARRSGQSFEANSRVVGKYRAVHMGAVVQGFLARVLLECGAVFEAGRNAIEVGDRFNRDADRLGRLAELPQLPGVGGSEIQMRVTSDEWQVMSPYRAG